MKGRDLTWRTPEGIEVKPLYTAADVTADDRTRDNPSVDGMGVRAWAGFPVHTPDGQVLGSFCVVDTDVH